MYKKYYYIINQTYANFIIKQIILANNIQNMYNNIYTYMWATIRINLLYTLGVNLDNKMIKQVLYLK